MATSTLIWQSSDKLAAPILPTRKSLWFLFFYYYFFKNGREAEDTECDSADGNFFNNPLGVWALAPLPACGSAVPAACLGSRPGDQEMQQQTRRWYLRDSLCLSCFPSFLENADANPVPVPAAAEAKQAFYEWGPGGGGEGLCYTSTWLGNAVHSRPAIQPRLYFKG